MAPAQGSAGVVAEPGGFGAVATGTMAVTPGQTLFVNVGGNGASTATATAGSWADFNGGGAGGSGRSAVAVAAAVAARATSARLPGT